MSESSNSYRAGAVIFNRQMTQCLMVFQRRSMLWGIPKGRREGKKESYRKCMLREVMEETGMDLKQNPFEYLDSLQIHGKCRIYLLRLLTPSLPECSPPKEKGEENHEITQVEWVMLEDAFERQVNSITRTALQNIRGRIDELRHWKKVLTNNTYLPEIIPPDLENILLNDRNSGTRKLRRKKK